MSSVKIRRNDMVTVRAGRDAGKNGKILQVLPAKGRAIVEGINLVKKALRKTQDNPQGGLADVESSVALSNLQLYCPDCKRGVRVRRSREADRLVRKCAKCEHVFEG
jgi:large subunit ribosomal protein L24